jgi:hypothetical protein
MQIWLYDNLLKCPVAAELQSLAEEQIDSANATWVPEFHRRRQMRASDQDFLVWDWPSKEKYLLAKNTVRDYAVIRGDRVEGLMILQEPEPSRLDPQRPVLYVRYLATAPWNRPFRDQPGRFRHVGTVLIGQAVCESRTLGCGGGIGLHSLSGSDAFYRKLGFHEFGPDPANRGLTYFELAAAESAHILEIKESARREPSNPDIPD